MTGIIVASDAKRPTWSRELAAVFALIAGLLDMLENLAFRSLAPARGTDETSGIDWTADV